MFMPRSTRLFLYTQPMDMRRSFWGLCGAVRENLKLDPSSGALFIFVNKRKDMIKIMWREENGYAIWMKRIESGSFQVRFEASEGSRELSLEKLSILLKKCNDQY